MKRNVNIGKCIVAMYVGVALLEKCSSVSVLGRYLDGRQALNVRENSRYDGLDCPEHLSKMISNIWYNARKSMKNDAKLQG